MAAPTITNWFGDLISHPRVVVDATSVDDIVKVLKDSAKYPSPVRAVGSNHSTSACGVAEGGTLIRMSGMNRILEIGPDTVTVQAGAIALDVARELEKHGLQFYVNTEIGSLSVGSASCAGTKDASMPGEFGQVGSYIERVKMVLPSGELLEVTIDQPELIQQVRSSYGTFGIIYEATYAVRPIVPMAVRHETFTLKDFLERLPELKISGESLMYYMFPFEDLITVEFRHYNPTATGDPNRYSWPLRNYMWAKAGPLFSAQVEANIADREIRYKVIDGFCAMWRFKLENLVRSDNTVAMDQIIEYPKVSDGSRYTFSLWAFPEEIYPTVLPQYFEFCRKYDAEKQYRNNMLYVGYRIMKDQQSLLSYSWDGNVMTIDPVSTANPGWNEFLVAYNQFCSDHGGIPLPNQTPLVTRAQVEKGLGERWKRFGEARKKFDPGNRLLNDYFKELLGVA
uniref:FAD linked oxidase domain protein n=1 Tax=Solibacter usitatus (strain Ellin6076) TaxID=234267 RepID=Q02BX1_SOLUE